MNVSPKSVVASLFLLFTAPAFASSPASSHSPNLKSGSAAPGESESARYARRCQNHAPTRGSSEQGTLLWGTRQAWRSRQGSETQRSVLVSVDIQASFHPDGKTQSVRLENGRLVAEHDTTRSLLGTVFQGTSSDGKPVEVALCGAEPAPDDPELVWYRIEAWNPVAQEWENPCAATGNLPDPRALAVSGFWDSRGAHHATPGKFTLACEDGAITKCIRWGYKPWASRDGQSLADLHQACTRMARADYCGNGRSHTRQGTTIDMYDAFGMLSPTTEASAAWNPAHASFEAAWAPDGATCMARTRQGEALEKILQECPGRFSTSAAASLGGGDDCAVQRVKESDRTALLRNRSY
ncbi:ADYC domain-containing protein [Hyalangium rubrum]|uniref:ADYC domain-containing protein n=1 Tax=Hyalangium rubrum TaxID=3103134 RepID=A0ABU5HG34_9BACT|nr:ADYC domain-containing protein [Hyalangium sp. s54d21]MDY7231778.1 ADYC domain-containing protein [Hyalangium sp. s54d21]